MSEANAVLSALAVILQAETSDLMEFLGVSPLRALALKVEAGELLLHVQFGKPGVLE